LAKGNKTPTEKPVYRQIATSPGPPRDDSPAIRLRSGFRFLRRGSLKVMPIQKGTVAVVDDDAGMRKSLKTLLSAFGYATYTFDSAEAFLGTAAGNNADCLVLDVQLGDMSGIILARRLAETGVKFPIIFMTAVDDPETRSQVAQLGCITCLRKPFSADLLIEAIVKAIG
jgi:FixJ family two-component response regulator